MCYSSQTLHAILRSSLNAEVKYRSYLVAMLAFYIAAYHWIREKKKKKTRRKIIFLHCRRKHYINLDSTAEFHMLVQHCCLRIPKYASYTVCGYFKADVILFLFSSICSINTDNPLYLHYNRLQIPYTT